MVLCPSDFVECLTVLVTTAGGRKDTEVGGVSGLRTCVGSKLVQYGRWKPSALSPLLVGFICDNFLAENAEWSPLAPPAPPARAARHALVPD